MRSSVSSSPLSIVSALFAVDSREVLLVPAGFETLDNWFIPPPAVESYGPPAVLSLGCNLNPSKTNLQES